VEITGISGNHQRVKPNINWGISLENEVARVEKQLIEQALLETGGVKSKAAKLLGTTRRIINYKMQKYGIRDSGD
jgi:transcriptional regulator with GAF, ATPase, and Fis domain